jgi:hypothetical protein
MLANAKTIVRDRAYSGAKQICHSRRMSAFGGKADITIALRNVCF